MFKVTVQYCASLREAAGISSEKIETDKGSLGELFEELRVKHRFSHTLEQVKMAVDNEFCPAPTPLKNGDHIILLPPFSGG
jgi:molybdopterin converting factor small subunit